MQAAIDSSLVRQGPVHPAPIALKHVLPVQEVKGVYADLMREQARDSQFVDMLRGFRETGGLARGDEVADKLRRVAGLDVSVLARWIVTRQVLAFDWQGERWLPLFQFDAATMERREDVRRVVAELAPVFDAWNLSVWFARPNPWLSERSPVAALSTDLPAVLQAAHADCFVAVA